MKIYGTLLSPYVRKVAVVAQMKGLAWEMTPFRSRTEGHLPEFRAASPFLRIPAIDDDGYLLADSTAIVHYLDARQPVPPLLPADPRQRGRAVWFEELMDSELAPAGLKVLFNRFVSPVIFRQPGNEARAAEGEAELQRGLDYLEAEVPNEGWLAGPEFSLGDIACASILRSLVHVDLGPADSRPRTLAWYRRVQAHPAWAAVAAIEDAPRR